MNQNAIKLDFLCENLKRELSRLAPGEQFLSVRTIMRDYNVSQQMVERALERFSGQGRLEAIPRKGYFIPRPVCTMTAVPPTYMVAVPNWISPDIDEIRSALEKLQSEYPDTRLLLYRFDFRHAIPPELALRSENVRGMLLMPGRVNTLGQDDVAALNVFRRHGPLVVLCHHLANFNVPSVGLDDMFAGNCVAHHLNTLGHKKIGILVSEPPSSIIDNRVAGIENYARLHEMETELIDCGIEGGETPQEKTYRRFEEAIRCGFGFTALAGVSGDSIAGALNACHNYRVSIPEQLSVAAIGNTTTTATLAPPLDTVSVELTEQVRIALEMLSGNAAGSRTVPPILVKRGSVRCIHTDNQPPEPVCSGQHKIVC